MARGVSAYSLDNMIVWLCLRDARSTGSFTDAQILTYCDVLRVAGWYAPDSLGAEADRVRWFPEVDAVGHVIRRPDEAGIGDKVTEEAPDDSDPTMSAPDEMEQDALPDPADAPAAERVYEYVFRSGDSLFNVAQNYSRHGMPVTVRQILLANPGLDPARLRVGQKILVPVEPPPIESPPKCCRQ